MFDSVKRKLVCYDDNEYYIEISPLTNTIRATLCCKGAIEAYLVGDFNNWEKNGNFKLNWGLDTNDGRVKMIKDITFPCGLKKGEYKYGYIIITLDGKEIYVDNLNEEKNDFYFLWEPFEESLEIKSSKDFVSTRYPVELIAVKNSFYGNITIEEAVLSLENSLKGVILENGFLKINEEVAPGTKIIVKAYDSLNDMTAYKEIEVREEGEKGTFVQFLKNDGLYYGENFSWNIWGFGENSSGKEFNLNIKTDLGLGTFVDEEKFIVRKRTWGCNWVNDWNEQTYTFYLGKEDRNLFCIYENNKILTSLKTAIEETTPKIQVALMDHKNTIKAYLSHKPLIGVKYGLYINGIKAKGVSTIVRENEKEVLITNLPSDIDPSDLLEVRASSMFSSCKVIVRDYLNDYYYGGNDLGVRFSEENISLRLWAPTAKKVELLIYEDYKSLRENPLRKYDMNREKENGTHLIKVPRKENEGKYYLYRLYFNDLSKEGKHVNKITYAVDPYAVAVGVNGEKGDLVDLFSKECVPEGWNKYNKPKLINKEDSIIYEMHIRDFTINENSGVSESLRGKFLGAVEEGTFYINKENGNKVKTGLDHLKELGVTHVHLLPVFDFASVNEEITKDENNRNWGYDPKNFNAIEGSYSTDPYTPSRRIIEFREMIKKFHDNGIRVVLDMVYNHMYETSNMDNIVPLYYFRSDKLGKYTNGSGCGNEMASEKPMVRKFILDSILHWIKNYHIDGLRFDLMELIDLDTMKEIVKRSEEIDEKILIYGEPWKGGDSPLSNGTYKGSQKGLGFSIFNDDFRNALRGNNDPSNGFINGEQHNKNKAWQVIEGIKGSINSITYKPMESINYLEAHDNYTLWDQIVKSQNHSVEKGHYRDFNEENILDNFYVKEDLLGASILFTSQGIPFIQSGAEILRSKDGDHNSYKSPDSINALNWAEKEKYIDVFNYYKDLISLRKNHSAFRMKNPEDIIENLDVYFYDNNDTSGVIIAHYKNNANEDLWKDIVVIYNGTTIDDYNVISSMPKSSNGFWNIAVKNGVVNQFGIERVSEDEIPKIKSHSMMILYDE
ncbi:type I pullulanase [Clostridium perfringens]|uniref:type I pullulanase n=1 Tax=Clostridium perfringens TaxID=1502 RepID=UPI0039EBF12A